MSDGFIDELREALEKRSALTGTDIDARYYHDLAGQPVALVYRITGEFSGSISAEHGIGIVKKVSRTQRGDRNDA